MAGDPNYKFRKIKRSRLVPVPSEVTQILPYERQLLKEARRVYELPEYVGKEHEGYQDKENPSNQKLLTSGVKATPGYQRCRNCWFWHEEEPDGWDEHETANSLLCRSPRSDYFNLGISPGHYCREFRPSELHQKMHELLWEHCGDVTKVDLEDPDESSPT